MLTTPPTASMHQGKTLTTAWVGDSRGVLGRETDAGWTAVDLTNDHKPTNPEEKARILRSNGRVERCAGGGAAGMESRGAA